MVSGDSPAEIEERIPDPAYRRNFVALARRLAPDGEDVTTVGFTAGVGTTERRVALTRPASQFISPAMLDMEESGTGVTVQGTLRFANSITTNNEIKLVDANNAVHKIVVPEGYMDDIVRPLWDCDVKVEGVRKGKKILLRNITPA